MTSREFRSMALSIPEAEERSHFDHPDFRVCGKIFASLGYPRTGWGMVKLTPRQQKSFVEIDPRTFVPVNGTWGLRGATAVFLRTSKRSDVRNALIAAWRNTAPKRLAAHIDVQ